MKKHFFILFFFTQFYLNVFCQTELIQNGNFSSPTGWTKTGSWYISSSYNCYHSSSGYAYAGDASGNPIINEWGNLKQSVNIPSTASAATLSFYTSQNTQEITTSTSYDYIEVYIWDSNNNWLETLIHISNLDAGSFPGCQTYSLHSYDLSSYIGQAIQVVFHVFSDGGPKNTMFRIDDVSLTYSAPATTRIINLAGNMNFGSVAVGNSSQQTLTISNTGNSTLSVTSINCPSGFSGNWSGNISAGGSQQVSITFSPTSATNYNSSIQVNSNATSGTSTISCSGTGTGSAPSTATVTGNSTGCVGSQMTFTATASNATGFNWTAPGCNPSSQSSGSTFTTTPSNSGNITISATPYNSFGNGTSGSLNVSINPSPTTPVISAQGGITSFCQGSGNAVLTVTNASSCTGCNYTWFPSGSGTSLTVYNSGNYYCTASNSCGGPSQQSNQISITVNTVPTASFMISGAGCNYSFTDNSTQNPISWNWNFGDPNSLNNTSVSQNPQHSFTSNGSYTVSLQATNTCGNNSTNQIVNVTNCTMVGTENIEIDERNFFITPNPIKESSFISFSIQQNKKITILLYDMLGNVIKVISSAEFKAGNHLIVLNRSKNISPGTYLIQLISDEFSLVKRIVFE